MSYSKGLFYTISRVFMLLLINVFASIVSTTLFAWILNLIIPSFKASNIKERIFSSGIWSILAWCVIIVMLVILFYNDGKKHSAYGIFDIFTICIASVFMFVIYFVPILFIDKAEDNVLLVFEGFYFPCKWLLSAFGNDYMIAVMIGIIPPIILAAASYCISHIIYQKRHPNLDPLIQNPYHQTTGSESNSEEDDQEDITDKNNN